MKFRLRRWLALVLSLAMCLSLATTVSWAAESDASNAVPYVGTIPEEGIAAPEGQSVTLTVDGIVTNIVPGTTYTEADNAVLTYTDNVVVDYNKGTLTHYFRQAVYGGSDGVDESRSVLEAAQGVVIDGTAISGGKIDIDADEFNGIYVTGGNYTVKDVTITSESAGIGGNDFAGYGAAVMATGQDTTMTLDNVTVDTKGVVHSALISGDGANVIVKNSTMASHEGVMPEGYVFTTTLGYMKMVPWMLGLSGNNRATNIIGTETTETFVNSTVTAEGWGILSVDDCTNVILTGINSDFAITGASGYGAYVIGGAVDQFFGCTIDVPDYAAILTTTGSVTFDDSSAENVSKLNSELSLGLTAAELAALSEEKCVITTGRSSIMFHGTEASNDMLVANVLGGTKIDSEGAIFLSRGAAAYINVDGADGAVLSSDAKLITQMVDLDKAVRVNANGQATYPGPWTQFYDSYEDIVKNSSFDVTNQSKNDVVNNISNIDLIGDFYNATTGKVLSMQGKAQDRCQNLVVNLDNASVTGVISASFGVREKGELYPEDYKLIGEVTNEVCPAINNGVIVSMKNGSVWNVTGVSYLTSLTVDAGSSINNAIITVDGVEVTPESGTTYTGTIVVTPDGTEVPDVPVTPDEPDEPGTPDEPDEPGTPDEPDTPVNPGQGTGSGALSASYADGVLTLKFGGPAIDTFDWVASSDTVTLDVTSGSASGGETVTINATGEGVVTITAVGTAAGPHLGAEYTATVTIGGATEPDEPGTPDEPDEPGTPDEPDEPGTPDEPDEPGTPDEPDEPGTPDEPDEPGTPDEPDEPGTPDEPDDPVKDESPKTGDISEPFVALVAAALAAGAFAVLAINKKRSKC